MVMSLSSSFVASSRDPRYPLKHLVSPHHRLINSNLLYRKCRPHLVTRIQTLQVYCNSQVTAQYTFVSESNITVIGSWMPLWCYWVFVEFIVVIWFKLILEWSLHFLETVLLLVWISCDSQVPFSIIKFFNLCSSYGLIKISFDNPPTCAYNFLMYFDEPLT